MKLDEAIKQAQADVVKAERAVDKHRKIRKALGDIQASKEILGGHFLVVKVDVHGLQTPDPEPIRFEGPADFGKYLTPEMIDDLPIGATIISSRERTLRRISKGSWISNTTLDTAPTDVVRTTGSWRLCPDHPPLAALALAKTIDAWIRARIVTETGVLYSTGTGGQGWRAMDGAGDCNGYVVDVDWLAARNPRPFNPLLAEDQQEDWWL